MQAAQHCALKLGFDEVPSVFQARCGPFKGLWVVDPEQDEKVDLIVRPSQQKYELGTKSIGIEDFDFEVLKTSTKPLRSDLTRDSIQALESLGASPDLFVQRQKEVLDTLRRIFHEDEAEGREALLELMADNMVKPGFEKALREFMDLEFHWLDPAFKSLRTRACADLRTRCCEELKLPLKNARRAWIVPDHTRTLQRGECFLQLPHRQESLAGKEVLLIRAPCYHSSSVLKLRIPEKAPKQLEHLVNVVVLNAWADREVPADAEVMGGDHDGDTALAIWDLDMVAGVQTKEDILEETETEVRNLKMIRDIAPEQLAGCLLEEMPLAAKSHAAFCEADKKRRDWADNEETFGQGFGDKTSRLAAICKAGVDCASNGRNIVVPEDLLRPDRPDWAYRGKQKKGAAYESERACGQIFRATCRFHEGEADSTKVVESFSGEQLGVDDWSPQQMSEATAIVLGKIDEFYRKKSKIAYMQHLSRGTKMNLEKDLFKTFSSAKHDYPEGLLGVAAYAVYLSSRTVCKSLSPTQKEMIQTTLDNVLRKCGIEKMEPPILPAKDIWRLCEREILVARSNHLHGVCPRQAGESFLVDPVEIRFSHPSISPEFRSGMPLLEAVKLLVSGQMRKRDFAKNGMPLPVRWYRGHWHTMGNRRLAVYRLYKFHAPNEKCNKILVRRVNEAEAFKWPWHRKFEIDERQGRSIRVRELGAEIGETLDETTVNLQDGQ
eukprot:Skav212906  [mRNA]  locus=scaffold374:154520:156682:- [translate_table: standard]